MPGYGITRGNGYSSSTFEYNPLRGNSTDYNTDMYSSLHYRSNQSNYHENNPSSNPTTTQPTNQSSLHPVSNSHNPYLALLNNTNTTNNLPDLTITHRPQPPNNNTTIDDENKENNTNGWNFSAFGLIKSAWNKIIGTPSKPRPQPHRSMSQPPKPPNPHNNPYAYTAISPSRQQAPITPPHQTRPLLSSIISASENKHGNSIPNSGNININSDEKSNTNTNGTNKSKNKKDEGGSTVISIHNLLQKTKLSPDDASWLKSKIDAVTHDKYDGSLSYIGPMRASSINQPSLVQQLDFDESATENSFKSHNTTSSRSRIISPLRNNKHSIIPSSIPCSRYMPHPGNYHKKVGGQHIRRKRQRKDVFNEEDICDIDNISDKILIDTQIAKKRQRLSSKTNYVKRRPFKDNYLRPINSLHSNYKIVPKYSQINNDKNSNKKQFETETKTETESKMIDKCKEKIIDIVDDKIKKKKMTKSKEGFCFGDNEIISRSNYMVENTNNGSHTQSQEISEEISENVIMKDNNNKPLKKIKRRSPLKDKKFNNNNNNNKIVNKNNDKENDDIMK
eukprot:913350_1